MWKRTLLFAQIKMFFFTFAWNCLSFQTNRLGRKDRQFQANVKKNIFIWANNKPMGASQKIVSKLEKKFLKKVPIVTKDQTWCFP